MRHANDFMLRHKQGQTLSLYLSHPVSANNIGRMLHDTGLQAPSVSKDRNSVVPDYHSVTQNGSRSALVISPAFGQQQDERFVVTHHTSRRSGVTPPPPLPLNMQELCENVQTGCDGLSQDTTRNLYNTMLRRLACCVSKHGNLMPY